MERKDGGSGRGGRSGGKDWKGDGEVGGSGDSNWRGVMGGGGSDETGWRVDSGVVEGEKRIVGSGWRLVVGSERLIWKRLWEEGGGGRNGCGWVILSLDE